MRFWDIRQGKATHTIATKGQNINMTVSPDGKMVVIGDRHDVITFIDTSTGKVIEELSGRQLAPKGIEVGQMRLYRALGLTMIQINEFKFSNSGDFLFVMIGDGSIRTYHVPSLDLYHKVTAHPAPCFSVDVNPRGRYGSCLVYIWHSLLINAILDTLPSGAQTLS